MYTGPTRCRGSTLTFLVASGLGGMCGGFSSSPSALAWGCWGGGSGAVRICEALKETVRQGETAGLMGHRH